MTDQIFYRPADGYVGDVIPFADDGQAKLYFLFDNRQKPKPGMPWRLVTTSDYGTLTEAGEPLPTGGKSVQDYNCYTGSVVKDATGEYHLFFTGNNPYITDKTGKSFQQVMHATSQDGEHWERHRDEAFGPLEGYEPYDWRDPYVFWDEDGQQWRMLLAARKTTGANRRRGVTAQLVSKDLHSWHLTKPFWDPDRFLAMECPEVFKWGDWWYFVYSEFTDAFTTKYRMAKSLDGLWLAPDHDTIDGRAFYAAKSLSLNGQRYFTGWIATKEGQKDNGAWQWAGNMFTFEAIQKADGTLGFRFPQAVKQTFNRSTTLKLTQTQLSSPDGYTCTLTDEPLPQRSYLRAEFDATDTTRAYGLMIGASDDGDTAYYFRLEPQRQRLVFDRWPRKYLGTEQWEISGDVPYAVELERPASLQPGRHVLEVIVEGSIAVAVLDGDVALSTRIYDHPEGVAGVFVSDGAVKVTNFTVKTRSIDAKEE